MVQDLNEYQLKAVKDNHKVCMVKANVGSGKTTVLISKIEYLLENKLASLDDMVILTFTNKAAFEIRERIFKNEKIKEIINNSKANDAEVDVKEELLKYCGTFHGIALKLLQTKLDVKALGYIDDFSVITPEEEDEIAQNIIFQNRLNIRYANKINKRIENVRKGKSKYGNMKSDDDVKKLITLLDEAKVKENKMSFDDLLEYSNFLFKNKKWTDLEFRPKWIIVDEFQDSDSMQLEFINNLKNENTNLFVVGDPNQVIYTWRGSSKNVFDKFKNDFEAEEITLPINYRSNDSILKLAKNVIKDDIDLKGIRNDTEKIIINKHYDEFNEAEYLSNKIKQIKEKDKLIKYKDIAIFYRTRNQSKVLEDVFYKNDIPYIVRKRQTVDDIPVISFLIKLLKASTNLKDISNLKAVYVNVKYGENKTNSYVKNMIKEIEKIDITDNLSDSYKEDKIKEVDKFYKKIIDFLKISNNKELTSKFIYEYFDLDNRICPTSSTYKVDKELTDKFLDKLEEYREKNNLNLKDATIEFINMSALYDINFLDDKKQEENAVNLMTLHSSKGLEFKFVFIIGANQGLIPIKGNKEELEEERRLFFVGITRAKDYLEISYYENPSMSRIKNELTEFLNNIPNELIENKQEKNEKSSIKDLKKMLEEDLNKNSKTENVKRVKHQRYGEGIILSEDDNMIKIKFENYGEKEFLKAFENFTYL